MTNLAEANITDAAVIIGVTVTTLRKWISQGMPVEKPGARGRSAVLSIPRCIDWYTKKKITESEPTVENVGMKELQLRKMRAETTSAEINAAKLRDGVIDREFATELFTLEAAAVKASLLSVPGKTSAVLAGLTDQRQIRELLIDEICGAFEEFTKRTIDTEAVANIGIRPDSGPPLVSAPKAKTERVGGGKHKSTSRKRPARAAKVS